MIAERVLDEVGLRPYRTLRLFLSALFTPNIVSYATLSSHQHPSRRRVKYDYAESTNTRFNDAPRDLWRLLVIYRALATRL